MRVCVRACVCLCVRACACVCACARACVYYEIHWYLLIYCWCKCSQYHKSNNEIRKAVVVYNITEHIKRRYYRLPVLASHTWKCSESYFVRGSMEEHVPAARRAKRWKPGGEERWDEELTEEELDRQRLWEKWKEWEYAR